MVLEGGAIDLTELQKSSGGHFELNEKIKRWYKAIIC